MALNGARNREEIDKWTRVFSKVDRDNDGRVPLLELHAFAAGAQRDPCLDERRVRLIADMAEAYRDKYTRIEEKHAAAAGGKRKQNEAAGGDAADSADALDRPVTSRDFVLLMTNRRAGRSGCARLCCKRAVDSVLPRDNRPAAHAYFDNDAKLWCWPRPAVFMIAVTLAQIGVFAACAVAAGRHWDDLGWLADCASCYTRDANGTRTVGSLAFAPQLRTQPWRFVSYALVHNGLLQLISASLVQLILGVPLELCQGTWRLAALYTLAVATGSLLAYAADGQQVLVGASAGAFALVAAFATYMVLNWPEMAKRWCRLSAVFLYLLAESSLAAYRRLWAPACERSSHAAHVAGALTGLLLGPALLRSVGARPRWHRALAAAGAVVYCLTLGAMAAVVGTVPPPPVDIELSC